MDSIQISKKHCLNCQLRFRHIERGENGEIIKIVDCHDSCDLKKEMDFEREMIKARRAENIEHFKSVFGGKKPKKTER